MQEYKTPAPRVTTVGFTNIIDIGLLNDNVLRITAHVGTVGVSRHLPGQPSTTTT
jgi:hypothetical protein